jgi:DNA polymerase delta subunit 1
MDAKDTAMATATATDHKFFLLDVFLCPATGYAYLMGVEGSGSGRTVCCRVTGYSPHLYVHNPETEHDEQRTLEWARTVQQDPDVSGHLARDLGEHVGMDITQQKLLFGYAPQAPYSAKFYATTPEGFKKMAKVLKSKQTQARIYEGDKDLRLAFLRENGLTIGGPVVIRDGSIPGPRQQRFSRCDLEITCALRSVTGEPFAGFPPLVVCAYDLETEGLDAEKHAVFQVSLCIRQFPFHEGQTRKIAISTIPMSDSVEDFEKINVDSERELIEAFVDLVVKERVTLLCGWNNLGFDAPFLNARAKKARCLSMLQRLSFLTGPVCKVQLKQKSLTSSAFGTNVFHAYQGLHGLVEMDGLLMARKSSSLKLNSYKLNNVARELLKSSKDDVSYDYMVEAVRCKDPDMITRVAKYCVQDSLLVLQILEHLKEVDNMIVMASLTNVPLNYIAERGQTVKCQSLVHMEAFRQGLIWNTLSREPSDTKYQGSTVIDSLTGLYTDPVIVMDFNSLYPSIMMAYNLSPETLVGTRQEEWSGDPEKLAYYDDQQRLHVFIGSDTHALFDSAGVTDAVIPHVLRTLIAERKLVRKEMATLDPGAVLERSQLNAKQLALKIMANSIYGTCGFANGPLPLVELAASTTAIGRMSIHKVKSALAQLGYNRVVAGDTDSVMLLIEGVTVQEAIDKANYFCSEHLNKLFPAPMKIEFEKVFYPYLIFTKKRYAGLLWEDATKQPKRDTKGIATKRRDFAPIVSQTVGAILDLILWKQDVTGAVDHLRGVLCRLAAGELPIEDLTIRKELKKLPGQYKTPSPHSTAAGKMMARDPANAPKLGERVPFVILAGQGEVYERAEDPSTVENVSQLDLLYYTQNQLQNPVTELFRAVGQADVVRDVNALFRECADKVVCYRSQLKYYKQRSIRDFFVTRR